MRNETFPGGPSRIKAVEGPRAQEAATNGHVGASPVDLSPLPTVGVLDTPVASLPGATHVDGLASRPPSGRTNKRVVGGLRREFGDPADLRILGLIERLGITGRELARVIGCDPSEISRARRAAGMPRVPMAGVARRTWGGTKERYKHMSSQKPTRPTLTAREE